MTQDSAVPRGERTRSEIMAAAHQLFLEKGYSGTSTRQIADKAGIALGGIYNHFSSKEAIFAAVFTERHPYLDILPAMNAAHGHSIETVVRDAARRMVDMLDARPDFLNLMFIEMVEFKGRHLSGLVAKVLPQMAHFSQRLAAAQARGEVRRMPLLMLIRAFLGLFVSCVITEQLAYKLSPRLEDNALNYFVDIFLHGVLLTPVSRKSTLARRMPQRRRIR